MNALTSAHPNLRTPSASDLLDATHIGKFANRMSLPESGRNVRRPDRIENWGVSRRPLQTLPDDR
jgi:hypothetical protein